MDGTVRTDIQPGVKVEIVQKAHQRSGEVTVGIVDRILTSKATHSRGIKVRLVSGEVGRVRRILDER